MMTTMMMLVMKMGMYYQTLCPLKRVLILHFQCEDHNRPLPSRIQQHSSTEYKSIQQNTALQHTAIQNTAVQYSAVLATSLENIAVQNTVLSLYRIQDYFSRQRMQIHVMAEVYSWSKKEKSAEQERCSLQLWCRANNYPHPRTKCSASVTLY